MGGIRIMPEKHDGLSRERVEALLGSVRGRPDVESAREEHLGFDPFDRWLARETAERESQGLIDRLSAALQERETNPYAESGAWQQAAYNLRREWFRVSIGLADTEEGDKYTLFLTEARITNLAVPPILPFTHWLGSLYAQLREASLKGTYPQHLAYGPPGRNNPVRPVGPLVEYRIENSRIRESTYHSADTLTLPVCVPGTTAEPAMARSSLRPIWLTIDPEQDSNFRWPFHGIYVLSGGPGTGKTSVALLRIRFLIEQQRQRDMEALLPPEVAPLRKDFFTEEDMLVVVWERHLQPYLKESLVESRFADVPVQYYDDWLNERLRAVVPIGEYRIEEGAASLEAVKRRFSEAQLADWINSWDGSVKGLPHPLAAKAYESILEFITQVRRTYRLAADPDRVAETWEVFRPLLDRTRFQYSQSGIETAIKKVRAELDNLARNCTRPEPVRQVPTAIASARQEGASETPAERLQRRERLRAAIPALQAQLTQLQVDLQTAVQNRYPLLLLKFYAWETGRRVQNSSFPTGDRDDFLRKVGEKISRKRLSRTDRLLILWLVQLVAERARRDGGEAEEALPDYSHVMVDEAQQYDPLVLRLFCRLSRPPFNSVTLVGDLRQRLREDGGVVMWDDLGVAIPEERRARLLPNYRWAEATFRAMNRLVRVLELPDVELKEPLHWPAGAGLPAEYRIFPDVDEEVEYIVDRINTLRSRPGAERWSIAVLLPDEYAACHKNLISHLDSVAINASWTEGANVRAGKEGVTLTNAESVVGLEFDAVFIVGTQHILPPKSSEVQRQRLWVMATRARQHLCVTSCGSVPLLSRWLGEK
jgi:hypothetical protein